MTLLPSEGITPGIEGQIKEWLENTDLYASGRSGALHIWLGPCRQLSTPDSDDKESDFQDHLEFVNRACVTRAELFVHLCVSTCDGKR